MGVEGELTAPKRAPSHSALSVSTVLSGRAAPVFWKVSKPASRSTKENLRFSDEGRASRRRRPAGMTSRPIPSPGMRPAACQYSVTLRALRIMIDRFLESLKPLVLLLGRFVCLDQFRSQSVYNHLHVPPGKKFGRCRMQHVGYSVGKLECSSSVYCILSTAVQ